MSSRNTSLEMENNCDWEEACLIGLGNHSLKKLLPSLEKKYGDNVSYVSSKNNKRALTNRSFLNLDDALKELNKNTLYIIATPPATHFSLSKKLLSNGKDIFVEKPSFIKMDQFNLLRELANKKKLVLVEMMMYLENDIVQKSLKKIKKNIQNLKSIDLTFTIPSNPENTFRNEDFFENSVITDIGCYPLNFLAYLGLPIENLYLNKVKINSSSLIIYEIRNINEPKIFIKIGCSGIYKNSIRVKFQNNDSVEISPFFFGLEGLREEISNINNLSNIEQHRESNCFQKLFDKSKENWLSSQSFRFSKMEKVIQLFERFSNDFKKY